LVRDGVFRFILEAVLLLSIGISGYHRWKARASGEVIERRREAPGLIALRSVVVLPLMLALLAFIIQPRWLAWSHVALPVWVRWVGAASGGAAVPLVWWVVSSLGRNISETVLTKRDHQLVTHGPYRRVRHPLYAVGILLLGSASLLTSSWLVAALTVLAAAGIQAVVIPREESALAEKFGNAYIEYSDRTGRLLPRLGRRG